MKKLMKSLKETKGGSEVAGFPSDQQRQREDTEREPSKIQKMFASKFLSTFETEVVERQRL